MIEILIQEEIFGAGVSDTLPVHLPSERLTLADLIVLKVRAKMESINKALDEMAHPDLPGLTEKEKVLNRERLLAQQQKRSDQVLGAKIDSERAEYEALAAFQQNAFFVLIDGKQRESLEEELLLSPLSLVHFIRLRPLVGG